MKFSLGGQIAVLLAILLLIPTASAHGADSFSFILRGESLQPESAEVVQNDTLIFYNVVEHERTLELDKDSDGVSDFQCTVSGMNSSGTDDECRLWLDPINWTAGDYEVEIFSNGSLWKTLSFTLIEDIHNETGPPAGYSFGDVDNDSDSRSEVSSITSMGILALAGIVFVITRRLKNE